MPITLRPAWVIATVETLRRGELRNAAEALFNSVRPHPPKTWRTGVPLVRIGEVDR